MKEKSNSDTRNESNSEKLNELVLINDNHNSFQNVIKSLMMVCQYDLIRSEQIAVIVDGKGRCVVKTAPIDEILEKKQQLEECGLTVEIN